MNILIVKTSSIGDVTHALPALLAIRGHYPKAHIAWVVEEAAADIILGHAALDRVLISPRKTWIRDLRAGRVWKTVVGFRAFVKALRDTHYDLLIDLQGLLRSSLWVVLAKADRKVGFDRGMEHGENSYLFLNERVPAIDWNRHALDRWLFLLDHIGIPHQSVEYDFPIKKDNEAEAEDLLRERGVTDRDCLIAIHPMTRWPTKLWENARFGQVADRLIGVGVRVLFTGSMEDRGAIDEICRHMTHQPIRLDGETSLKTLAAIYKRVNTLLTTDNGAMHIAAAIGTPVVALFGPTAPWRTGPYGTQHTVLRSDVSCSPCFKKRCLTQDYEERACLGRISVEEVVNSVLQKVNLPAVHMPESALP